ncbi:MAG: phage Gp37/Gp68 family protein [Chelatococcus sp.]|nr:MAG: phage Gp37/Gp68 family protein [Chelatococcus sp.]
MSKTAIEWTEQSWNPIVGCSVVSPGCTHCYAMAMAHRLERMGTAPHYAGLTQPSKAGPVWTGRMALAPESVLLAPLRRRKPTTYFVNSMGDLFHEDVPDAWIDRVFAVMALCPQHTFQVLTKRAGRMRDYLGTRAGDWQIVWPDANPPGSLPISRHEQRLAMRGAGWPDAIIRPTFPLRNVWLGVSTEDQKRADERIPDLLATPAAIRFVSAEPLLGPIDFRRMPSPVVTPEDEGYYHSALDGGDIHYRDSDPDYDGKVFTDSVDGPMMEKLDWIIVGGESGPNARPMHPDWARSIRDQCAAAGTAFFFKQWGEWKGCGPGRIQESNCSAVKKWDETAFSCRVGKTRAGRLLDGVEHKAMPSCSALCRASTSSAREARHG